MTAFLTFIGKYAEITINIIFALLMIFKCVWDAHLITVLLAYPRSFCLRNPVSKIHLFYCKKTCNSNLLLSLPFIGLFSMFHSKFVIVKFNNFPVWISNLNADFSLMLLRLTRARYYSDSDSDTSLTSYLASRTTRSVTTTTTATTSTAPTAAAQPNTTADSDTSTPAQR